MPFAQFSCRLSLLIILVDRAPAFIERLEELSRLVRDHVNELDFQTDLLVAGDTKMCRDKALDLLQAIQRCDSDKTRQCIHSYVEKQSQYDTLCKSFFDGESLVVRWIANYREGMSYSSNTIHLQLTDDVNHLIHYLDATSKERV